MRIDIDNFDEAYNMSIVLVSEKWVNISEVEKEIIKIVGKFPK